MKLPWKRRDRDVFEGRIQNFVSVPCATPAIGSIEFLIHAQCGECGWRCAIPGEGQRWPECPICRRRNCHRCHGRSGPEHGLPRCSYCTPLNFVMPKRGQTFDVEPISLGYLGLLVREDYALPKRGDGKVRVTVEPAMRPATKSGR